MCKIEELKTNLARQLHWISAADSKIGPMLVIDTAMLGVLAAVFTTPKEWDCYAIVSIIVVGLASILLLLSVLFLSFATFPRLDPPPGPRSLIFFGGISKLSLDRYAKGIEDLSSEDYLRDLIAQCYQNAKIANSKYIWVKRSMVFLFLAILPWIAAIVLLYGGNYNGN